MRRSIPALSSSPAPRAGSSSPVPSSAKRPPGRVDARFSACTPPRQPIVGRSAPPRVPLFQPPISAASRPPGRRRAARRACIAAAGPANRRIEAARAGPETGTSRRCRAGRTGCRTPQVAFKARPDACRGPGRCSALAASHERQVQRGSVRFSGRRKKRSRRPPCSPARRAPPPRAAPPSFAEVAAAPRASVRPCGGGCIVSR